MRNIVGTLGAINLRRKFPASAIRIADTLIRARGIAPAAPRDPESASRTARRTPIAEAPCAACDSPSRAIASSTFSGNGKLFLKAALWEKFPPQGSLRNAILFLFTA